MNWAIVFLAYGDEHISEFNITAKCINEIYPEARIIVATDNPKSITENVYKIIPITGEFNYNLKRIPISEALNEFNTILFLDTDILIRSNIDFSIMDTISKNVSEILYVDDIVPAERQHRDGSIEWIKEYLDKLNELWIFGNPYLIPEGRFIIKYNTIEQRDLFLETWERGFNLTINVQPQQYGLNGCMEGFLIWIAANVAGIPIKRIWDSNSIETKKTRKLFESIMHFAAPQKKLKQTIL